MNKEFFMLKEEQYQQHMRLVKLEERDRSFPEDDCYEAGAH